MQDQNVFHHQIRQATVNVTVASTTRGPTWTIEIKDAAPDEVEAILTKTRDVLSRALIEQEQDDSK